MEWRERQKQKKEVREIIAAMKETYWTKVQIKRRV